MAWFEDFRTEYGFAAYKDNRTAVTYDIPLCIVTYLCVLVSIATLIATLGIRGRERWSTTIRAMYSVGIGSIILACLVGYGWQEGRIRIKCPYLYRNSLPFEGYIGIKVGLNNVNVTLEGNYRTAAGAGYVHYAESMPWSDFGHEPERYQYFLRKGLPDPILKVMGFLTVDEGELRWGRSLHASGYYTMALLWTSFAFWIVSSVLLCSVIVYGAYMFTLTGLTMLLACVTYHVCQCRLPMGIHFGEELLTVSYSWCYWLTLVAGCLTLILGIILILADHFAHEGVAEFFHLEKLGEEDVVESDSRPERPKPLYINSNGASEGGRRGSIFLDPCRQPADTTTRFLPGLNGVFVTASGDVSNRQMKANPMFCGVDETKAGTADDQDDEVRIEMERVVCGDSEVCMSTAKPSLATLKEHRDNHANERLSVSSPGQKGCKHSIYGRLKSKLTYPDDLFKFGDKDFYVPNRGQRRDSCPSVVFSSRTLDRSISEASCEGEKPDADQSRMSREVFACVESDEGHSHEGSMTSVCTPDEPDSDGRADSILHSEHEDEVDTTNKTPYECDGTSTASTDFVVNIS